MQAWRDECVVIEARIAQLSAKIQELKQKIAAAEFLLPAMAPGAQTAGADSIKNWTDLVLFALEKADGGRTQRYMLEFGQNTPMADRIKRSPNGLYNAVSRLLGRREIVRHGDLFYLPQAWEAIQAGDIVDNPEPFPQSAKTTKEAIFDLLADGTPRSPKEIFDAITNEDVAARLRRNPQYGYTLLGRMYALKQLEKRDGLYTIPDGDSGDEKDRLPSNVTLFTGLRAQDAN